MPVLWGGMLTFDMDCEELPDMLHRPAKQLAMWNTQPYRAHSTPRSSDARR